MMIEAEALSTTVALLISIKRSAQRVRLSGVAGAPTEESRCLFRIEGDVEEFLNELALVDSDLASPWRMTPEFAADSEEP